MNVDAQQAAWLAAELDETLTTMGYVGLYDALWTINGASLGLAPARARELARSVVVALLEDRAAGRQLRRLAWPSGTPVSGPLDSSTLDNDAAWGEGESYVALVQADYGTDVNV